jgi:hypothetical protein
MLWTLHDEAFYERTILRRDVKLVIGRPEIDAWDVVSIPEGLSRGKVPIEFEVL